MDRSRLVFRMQFLQFKQERGMLAFYALVMILSGVVMPLVFYGSNSFLLMAAIATALFLNPMLADSLAGERERRTLEMLLSSPLQGEHIIWGKVKFYLCFALSFFGLTVLCGIVTAWISSGKISIMSWQGMYLLLSAVFYFGTISVAGVCISAMAENTRVANSRVSRIAYILGLLFTICVSVIMEAEFGPAFLLFCSFTILMLGAAVIYAIKSAKLKQSDFFENVKADKADRKYIRTEIGKVPKSHFLTVLGFEFKYIRRLKILILNFGLLCIAPLLLTWVAAYYLKEKINLDYAVLVTVLMIPRVPANLVAFSIGGEKAYKTGESLLSTPLKTSSIFLAKCTVPIVIAAFMLILSSGITLLGTAMIGWIVPDMRSVHSYSAAQLVLLYPLGLMTAMIMTFLSAFLAVNLKTPRHGLYASSIITFLFVIPVLMIINFTDHSLLWSVGYTIALLLANLRCIRIMAGKISRFYIISKL